MIVTTGSHKGGLLYVLVLGSLLGVFFLLPFTGGYLSGVAAVIYGLVLLLLSAALVRLWNPDALGLAARTLLLPQVSLFLLVLLVKVTHDVVFIQLATGTQAAMQHMLWSLLLLISGILIAGMPVKENLLRLAVLGLAFSIYISANIAGYNWGMTPHVLTTGAIKPIEGSSITERMVAPFGPGLNNFGCFAIICVQINILIVWFAWRSRNRSIMLIAGLGVATGCYALWLVQIRSGILGVVFTLLYVLAPMICKRWIALFAAIGLIILPAAFINLKAIDWLEDKVPLILESSLSRNDSEMLILGGRAYVYDYGWEILLRGEVGLFGKGMVERDSGPGLAELAMSVEGGTFSFHNAALESLIVYGPVLGSVILILFLMPMFSRLVVLESAMQDMHTIMLGLLGSLYVTSYLEAFNSMWIFWMIMYVAVAMIAQLNTSHIYSSSGSTMENIKRQN